MRRSNFFLPHFFLRASALLRPIKLAALFTSDIRFHYNLTLGYYTKIYLTPQIKSEPVLFVFSRPRQRWSAFNWRTAGPYFGEAKAQGLVCTHLFGLSM